MYLPAVEFTGDVKNDAFGCPRQSSIIHVNPFGLVAVCMQVKTAKQRRLLAVLFSTHAGQNQQCIKFSSMEDCNSTVTRVEYLKHLGSVK